MALSLPISGRQRVAKFIASVASHFWTGVTLEWTEVNGQLAVLMLRDGTAVALATIDASVQGIDQILLFMRPSKLFAVSRSGQQVGESYSAGPAVS
jgi:RNA polymerase sigma-70 factor, ECF subfamily